MRDKELIHALGAMLEAIKQLSGPEKFRTVELQSKISEAERVLEGTGYYAPDES